MARGQKTERKQRSALADVVARDYTIHLHTRVHNIGFKHRAPTAIKAVVKFAQQQMGTKEVKIDASLNAAIWSRGIKSVPHRVRVRLQRKRNDDEGAKEKLYTLATFIPTKDFKGLQTTVAEVEEAEA